MTEFSSNDKPALLKAIELILAEPTEIRKESLNLQKKFQQCFSKKILMKIMVSANLKKES